MKVFVFVLLLFLLVIVVVSVVMVLQVCMLIKLIGDCICIDQINEWYIVDNCIVIVCIGLKCYCVDLQSDCLWLGLGLVGLIFWFNLFNQVLGNSCICGEVGEMVCLYEQLLCVIQLVQIIDKVEFDCLLVKV